MVGHNLIEAPPSCHNIIVPAQHEDRLTQYSATDSLLCIRRWLGIMQTLLLNVAWYLGRQLNTCRYDVWRKLSLAL